MALLRPTPRARLRGAFAAPAAALALVVAWAWLLAAAPANAAPASPEYQLKAVFLFNFTRFVEWPATTYAADDTPFVIGVLGHDPFGDSLDEAVKDEKVDSHPMVVRRLQSPAEIAGCQIVFLGRDSGVSLDALLAATKNHPVLTVGDGTDFAKRGGMMRFVVENSRVRLRVNLGAVRQAGLVVSSKLLRSVEIVKDGEG